MVKLLFKTHGILLYSNGDAYKQIGPDDIIEEGALHSIAAGFYYPLTSIESIGSTPNKVSPGEDRLFFNPLSEKEKKAFLKNFDPKGKER
jgi:hypothetical protein